MDLSVVVPVYNEKDNIPKLNELVYEVISQKLGLSYEIIFVDDGSKDGSWEVISSLSKTFSQVKGFRFSRNFGHQYALRAGIDTSIGEAVIMLDADLQHPPSLIEKLVNEWKNGYEIVYALRQDTKGVGWSKKITSNLFYKILNYISDIELEKGASDFRLIDRKAIDQIKSMDEYFLFLRGMVKWIGFKSKSIEYIAEKRFSGESKYSLKKMLNLASNGIMSFSIKPLRLATVLGFLISTVSFVYILYALIAKFILDNTLAGWTSLLISVLFLGGIQLLTIGIIGEYIGKIFVEIKNRPKYIIAEKTE